MKKKDTQKKPLMYYGEFDFAGYDYRAVGLTKSEVEKTLKEEYNRQVKSCNPPDKMSWTRWKEYVDFRVRPIRTGVVFGGSIDDEE